MDDGIERLRGQLRETAQRGQADNYGGDQIEDAADGARRAERGVEDLLKKKISGKRQKPEEGPRTAADPPTWESPSEPPPRLEAPAERSSPLICGYFYQFTDDQNESLDELPRRSCAFPGCLHLGIVAGWNEAGKLLVCHCSSGQNNVVITEFAASGFTVVGRRTSVYGKSIRTVRSRT